MTFVIDVLTCFEERIPQKSDVVAVERMRGGLILAEKGGSIRGPWTAWLLKVCDRFDCRFE